MGRNPREILNQHWRNQVRNHRTQRNRRLSPPQRVDFLEPQIINPVQQMIAQQNNGVIPALTRQTQRSPPYSPELELIAETSQLPLPPMRRTPPLRNRTIRTPFNVLHEEITNNHLIGQPRRQLNAIQDLYPNYNPNYNPNQGYLDQVGGSRRRRRNKKQTRKKRRTRK